MGLWCRLNALQREMEVCERRGHALARINESDFLYDNLPRRLTFDVLSGEVPHSSYSTSPKNEPSSPGATLAIEQVGSARIASDA